MNSKFHDGFRLALEHGGNQHSLEDVIQQVVAGDAQLWETEDAAIVTEIHQTPRARVLHFWLATGELEEVILLHRAALDWGKRTGCTQATLAGRRGWERVLAAEGWGPKLTLLWRSFDG